MSLRLSLEKDSSLCLMCFLFVTFSALCESFYSCKYKKVLYPEVIEVALLSGDSIFICSFSINNKI